MGTMFPQVPSAPIDNFNPLDIFKPKAPDPGVDLAGAQAKAARVEAQLDALVASITMKIVQTTAAYNTLVGNPNDPTANNPLDQAKWETASQYAQFISTQVGLLGLAHSYRPVVEAWANTYAAYHTNPFPAPPAALGLTVA